MLYLHSNLELKQQLPFCSRSKRLKELRPKVSHIQQQWNCGKWKFCVRKQGLDMRSTTMPTLLLLQISTAWVINTMTVGGRKKRRKIVHQVPLTKISK